MNLSYALLYTCLFTGALAQQPPSKASTTPVASTASTTTTKAAENSTAQNDVQKASAKIIPPRLIRSVDPDFSEQARKARFSGFVEIHFIVDTDGNPTDVRVFRSAGLGLDEEAVKAVKQYKFRPAMKDGKPVKVDLYVDVNFQIHKRWW